MKMMFDEFRKTLFKVIHLRSIIGYNGLVFALKKTPLIGNILPNRLYSTTALKVIYWIFHVIKEMFLLFIGKIAGLGAVYLVAWFMESEYIDYGLNEGVSASVLFGTFALFFFIIYALCGIFLNLPVFRCPPEKEYLVFMLRMNARKLNNTLFVYDLLKLFIGYLLVIPFAAVIGVPFWACLGIPVLAVFVKLFGTGFQAFTFKIKNRLHKPLRGSAAGLMIRLVLTILLLPIVFILVVNGFFIPLWAVLLACGVLMLLGLWGFHQLNTFDSNLHRRALHDNITKTEVVYKKSDEQTKQFKKINNRGRVSNNKKGFEYLNALFVRRHRKILVATPVIYAIGILALLAFVILSFISNYHMDYGDDATTQMITNNLWNLLLLRGYEDALMPLELDPGTIFIRYIAQDHMLAMVVPLVLADISFRATQAMYINCDNSLMTFSFFKQRKKIMQLFDIRLKQLIKLNILPVIACGICVNMLLFVTGGQDYPFHYLVNILICVIISAVNSTTGLALYYLFQPFTTSVNVKGGAFMGARVIIALVTLNICWIPCNSLMLMGILIVFASVYIMFLRMLVSKFAPKTWRVKA